ncbi:MAG: thioredoxin-dependent thiol peroxidase [Sphaerochaetaceae bacterium]|nr:thioredoxin-dependent thiol peroxidase [Sphaerochaetaceae bacterium]MDC7236432.1 thioredoxin-dependent thiol peroxidase [Sphaerochaetaceae bacterium]MDC7243562.1 thioredoxin-dependent thiol peroxidase [Sphaerochaetaceae bacterium]MDC7248910.1 thioredoxin-dependent thiol peroxidase [Sphaerochaetaceae bacterium]
MAYLEINEDAIDFTLPNKNGDQIKLSDFKGKKIVLYFYPKDNTKGCTIEALDFKAKLDEFYDKNAVVLGISKDSVKSHCNFSNKYELNFDILSDEDATVINQYGVWQLKKNYGKEYYGIVRTTYVIDENFKIKNVYKVSKVANHVEKVLSEL